SELDALEWWRWLKADGPELTTQTPELGGPCRTNGGSPSEPGDEVGQRFAVLAPCGGWASFEGQDRVPAPISSEISRQAEKPVATIAGLVVICRDPELRMKDPAGPWSRHRGECILNEREQLTVPARDGNRA